ncbi:uncharacterized protein LOC129602244 [Paramacrobiotus metropolitanus]|uniref:uncharacterized protein LOC129602244 n=1 Tax=Paramacrobiotus metropolitanus TaxID=2943436 RepID=UPI00244620CB|nr:uncharacterized protein LOC129602244 [Paramacrobiotus metropolitanus]
MKSLYTQCPALKDDAAATGGWYNAEFRLFLGALCSTTVGPVKYLRALSHCNEEDEDALDGCCNHLDMPAGSGENDNASVAHQRFCNKLKKTASYFDGAHDVAAKCGQDVEQALKDAFKQAHTAYCKK